MNEDWKSKISHISQIGGIDTSISLWIGNFSLTFTFSAIKESLGWANNFWLYGFICLIGFIVLYYKLPETKNKTLEQIEKELVN
jgi:hypothetical protein